jgi:truncated hemoglobin YjbI
MLKPNERNPLPQLSSDSLVSINVSHLQAKVTALGGDQAQRVDWLPLVARYLSQRTLATCIPDSLVAGSDSSKQVFVNREDGVVLYSGETAEVDFLSAASVKNKQLRNLNPMGIRYPKFLSFRAGTLEFTFMRKKAVKEYIRRTRSAYTLQRYIVPENYTIRKHVIHWRRTKPANVYALTSRLPLQSPRPGLSSEYAFVVSAHSVEQFDVVKEGLREELVGLLETVKVVLEQTLRATLEEFAFEALKSQDKKWYILDVSWVKGPTPLLPPEIPSNEDISRALLQRISRKPVPLIGQEEQIAASIGCYDHSRLCMANPISLPAPALVVARNLAKISSKLDHIRSESTHLKQEASLIMKLNISKDVLTRVIHRVYESILRDSRLSRYYMDKSRVYSKVEAAIRQVFHCGASRPLKARIKTIHCHFGITEQDFELYLRYFTEAMVSEALSPASIDLTIRFLSEFKDLIVQTK